MHILLLTAYFPPEIGSASHLFYDLGQGLVARGHSVSVVTGFPSYHAQGDLTRYRGQRWMVEPLDGMTVFRILVPELGRNAPIGRGLWQFGCAVEFALASLRVARADAALVYSPPLPLGLSAWTMRLFRGTRFILNVQDLFPQSAIDLGVLRSGILTKVFRQLERFLYRRADLVTVHSRGNRDHVMKCGGTSWRTYVVPNSIDTESIRPEPRLNAIRAKLGLDGHFVASFAGVMGYSQDLDTVLEAARMLADHHDIRFLLVGDGVEKERLVKKTAELGLKNVIWLPMQAREEYPAVLHASDVGLATLHAEVKTPVVPSKILSIMAAGRPVVAAMDLQGDAPRLVTKSQCGYCVGPGQPQALADLLLRLSADPLLCARLGNNGRLYAEARFSKQAMAQRYEELFTKVVKPSYPPPA